MHYASVSQQYQVQSGLLTHKAAECDDRSDTGEVEENDWSQALCIQTVQDVAFVLSVAALHVRNHAAK